MRALYIPVLPRNPELRPKQSNATTVLGARMFGWNALCALLTYGTYDTYFVPGFTDQQKDELIADGLTPDTANRLVPAPSGSKSLANDSDQLVLATMGPELRTLATIRHRLRRYDLPLCGFIHSINSARTVFNILQQYFAGLRECDLLLCSSRAGLKTIEVYIEEIDQWLPPNIRYRARRILVPLGVRIPTVDPTARVLLRRRLALAPEHTIALFFGRLSQMSKADLGPLLLALSVLSRRGTMFHLVIAGDDTQTNEAPRLTALAADLNCLTNLTVWVNPTADDKHLLYSGADIFISPTDNIQETFGLAVAEALAYGVPAVVSDWDGYRDLVTDGETGFLVRSFFPTDIGRLQLADCTSSMLEEDLLAQSTTIDFVALCEKLEKLVLDSALRRQMGRAGRQFAEDRCSWKVIVNRYEELWHESIQMAKAACRGGTTRSPILSVSLENCFGHFASAKRSSESECFITAEGREWLRRPDRFYFLCPLHGRVSPEHFSDLLRTIDERPGIPVKTVADLARSDGFPISVNEMHWSLARLFKYGLVMSSEDRRQPSF
ncbi:MAG: glycosyltransferase family 4 protein [Terriglobales bacterium]